VQCTLTLFDPSGAGGFGETVTSNFAVQRGYEEGRAWADVNGDGKADFIRIKENAPSDPVGAQFLVNLSTGTNWNPAVMISPLLCGYNNCLPPITRIRVAGAGGSGGGSNLSGWHLISSTGASQGAVSGGALQPLYTSIDWTTTLTDVIPAGQSFALVSSEGSTAVSRTFEFYGPDNALLGTATINPYDSARIVRSAGFPPVDEFTSFTWNGTTITATQKTITTPISRIRVSGASGSGGGSNLLGWYRVSSTGANFGAVSSGISQPLFQAIDWSATLTTPIQSGESFALVGSEGSTAVSRTFEFYDPNNFLIATHSVGPYDTTRIVRSAGFPATDEFTIFIWDGMNLSVAQQNLARTVARIRVFGSAGGGGGSNLLGWYRVSSTGANFGAVSSGISQPLFRAIDWTATLTSPIQRGESFALVGSEGSTAVSRTFEFYDPNGGLIGTHTVGPFDSARIVRSSSFSSGEEFTQFTFDGSTVTDVQTTSQ
jgi:hypothetical protein